jgi:regulator of protease activity HflC (stomatin/prohibitin superfamily)
MYFEGFGVFVLVVVAVVVFYLLRAIRMVPQGYNYTVERFGKYVRTCSRASGSLCRSSTRSARKQNMMEQVIPFHLRR